MEEFFELIVKKQTIAFLIILSLLSSILSTALASEQIYPSFGKASDNSKPKDTKSKSKSNSKSKDNAKPKEDPKPKEIQA